MKVEIQTGLASDSMPVIKLNEEGYNSLIQESEYVFRIFSAANFNLRSEETQYFFQKMFPVLSEVIKLEKIINAK